MKMHKERGLTRRSFEVKSFWEKTCLLKETQNQSGEKCERRFVLTLPNKMKNNESRETIVNMEIIEIAQRQYLKTIQKCEQNEKTEFSQKLRKIIEDWKKFREFIL